MILWVGVHHHKSPPCQVWTPYALRQWRCDVLVVEGQDWTCPDLNLLLLFISKLHGIPCSHTKISEHKHNNLPVSLMKDFRSWSHMSTKTTDRGEWESGKRKEWKKWERTSCKINLKMYNAQLSFIYIKEAQNRLSSKRGAVDLVEFSPYN